ncbi:MAG: Isopropylmalate/citramalate isomerase small subunit [Candidatus Woesearchaeota archaeon]|nr:Isopropylmalate/citramalate isomerase small subunit [Candidatus Woesearchaeota archaeon]
MAKVWKIGDDVNTDEIIPCSYYPRSNNKELGRYALIDSYPEFANNKKQGDILVAGHNFGCGSSREYAALALLHSGLKCVIAKSFARIFYRNCINIGFPILISRKLHNKVKQGHEINVQLSCGKIILNKATFKAKPLPEFVSKIISYRGIVQYLRENNLGDLQNV